MKMIRYNIQQNEIHFTLDEVKDILSQHLLGKSIVGRKYEMAVEEDEIVMILLISQEEV